MRSEERVTCAICGANLKRLAFHVRTRHGMVLAEYARKYPDLPVRVGDRAWYGMAAGEGPDKRPRPWMADNA